jgi:hypothetical protein
MASNINRSSVFVHGPSAFLWCWTMKNCHHEPFFLMVQVSYQLMMSDLNPLQSMCLPPPPPNCLSIHLPLFKKKKWDGNASRSNPIRDPGNSRVQLSRGELYYYYQPVRVLYIRAVWIHRWKKERRKATSGPHRPPARPRAIILTFASVIYYWHGRPQCYRLRHATPLSPPTHSTP